jgi:steroid 5-alpha reductase family enzyme
VLAPALLMGIMAWGMWRARYWAVLGFQLILVFLIFSAVYGLALQAATVAQVLATLALLAVAGSFFFFMVKAMARIQMPTRNPD